MKRLIRPFPLLLLLIAATFAADILWGNVSLPPAEVWQTLTGETDNPILREIVLHYRLPKALSALLGGGALALSGLLMQSVFRNPLAGPDVLGVSAGATLGVALLTLGGSLLASLPDWGGMLREFAFSSWGQSTAAIFGAGFVMVCVLLVAVRIPQVTTLLIMGLMAGYFIGALVSVLQSVSNPDTLKLFVTWTFGSLSAVGWEQLQVLGLLLLAGLLPALLLTKSLNLIQLGDRYATTLGVRVGRTRYLLIFSASLLTGAVTAFAGPIAFVGVTMPHIARGLFLSPDHRVLMPASFLCGGLMLLVCDLLSQLPAQPLPLNAVTALIGAPILVAIILRRG